MYMPINNVLHIIDIGRIAKEKPYFPHLIGCMIYIKKG